jgi:hypothetical protein
MNDPANDPERLTLRQADQAREDFAAILDDGVTVTWHATPVGNCAVLIGRPIDECSSCRPDGRCQHCGLANGARVQGCTLPKALCQSGPCPMKSALENG